jgi:hypothetical protein
MDSNFRSPSANLEGDENVKSLLYVRFLADPVAVSLYSIAHFSF